MKVKAIDPTQTSDPFSIFICLRSEPTVHTIILLGFIAKHKLANSIKYRPNIFCRTKWSGASVRLEAPLVF
jgi:hypothetical protein